MAVLLASQVRCTSKELLAWDLARVRAAADNAEKGGRRVSCQLFVAARDVFDAEELQRLVTEAGFDAPCEVRLMNEKYDALCPFLFARDEAKECDVLVLDIAIGAVLECPCVENIDLVLVEYMESGASASMVEFASYLTCLGTPEEHPDSS